MAEVHDPLLDSILKRAIFEALVLLPAKMSSPSAWHALLAIGLQESKLSYRWQVLDGGGRGPARGLWQFELGGGVRGVLDHAATRDLARAVCAARGVRAEPRAVWAALERDDVLAAAFARLLLWTAFPPLPGRRQSDQGWRYYLDLWRPGKPHEHTWVDHWDRAGRFVYGE